MCHWYMKYKEFLFFYYYYYYYYFKNFFFFFKRNKNGTNILSTQYLIIMIVNGFIEIAALLDLNSCRLYKLMSLISVTLFHTCFYYFVCFFFFHFTTWLNYICACLWLSLGPVNLLQSLVSLEIYSTSICPLEHCDG